MKVAKVLNGKEIHQPITLLRNSPPQGGVGDEDFLSCTEVTNVQS